MSLLRHRSRLLSRSMARLTAAGLAVALDVVACQSGGRTPTETLAGPTDFASATPQPTYAGFATASPAPTSTAAASAEPAGRPTPTPAPAPTTTPTTTARRPNPLPASTANGWQPSAALVAAKAQGRVVVDSGGFVTILPSASAPASYPRALTLDTTWTGLIQEPPRLGVDDAGKAYRDDNYSQLCGPGAAAVTLYYWKTARAAVTTKSGSFTEPLNLGTNRTATTTWNATDADGNGRGMIMYLAEVLWPGPDRGRPWWTAPGMMTWSARPPSTNIWNLADGINWEASGGRSVGFFYTIVSASNLTQAALLSHVRSDIAAGVPVVIAARTSNGSVALPFWRVTATRSAVNHFITVVGYDDAAGTYTTIDTCGRYCNSMGVRSGVGHISQAALYTLIRAESDNDGIVW